MEPEAATETPTPELSVVLPSYSEADNLVEFLPQLLGVLPQLTPRFEVLVIDTMLPKDNTPILCRQFGVQHVPRRGSDEYGSAIRTGIADARGERVAIMDVDGSHDPEFLRKLWDKRQAADVVIASRYMHGGSTDNPLPLVAFSKILNEVFAFVLKIPVEDISNSFRLYRGDLLRNLDLKLTHFDIQEEMLGKLIWSKTRPASVLEVPFHFQRRSHGKSKRSMTVFIAAFIGAMWRLWLTKRQMQKRQRD